MAVPSRWTLFAQRSARMAKDQVAAVLRMDPAYTHSPPKALFTFKNQADVAQYVVGSDADIGGYSSAKLELDPQTGNSARFHGEIRTEVRPQMQGKMKSGYAGFRNKMRPSLFGNVTDDLSLYKYLCLRVKAGGDPQTRNGYFVNIQTDGPIETDLWQHRLYLRGNGQWEDVLVPLHKFILTNSGEAVNSNMAMMSESIKSIGISLLGGNGNIQGNFELGIEYIGATTDVNDLPSTASQTTQENAPSPASQT